MIKLNIYNYDYNSLDDEFHRTSSVQIAAEYLCCPHEGDYMSIHDKLYYVRRIIIHQAYVDVWVRETPSIY